jgi:hypothetical protein
VSESSRVSMFENTYYFISRALAALLVFGHEENEMLCIIQVDESIVMLSYFHGYDDNIHAAAKNSTSSTTCTSSMTMMASIKVQVLLE